MSVSSSISVSSEPSVFRDLDAPFQGIGSGKRADSMRYSGADVLVQTSFVIPVPVPFVGSVVKYQFETEGGDIAFGLTFLSNAHSNHAAVDIVSLARVPSDQELITGSFKAPTEGTLVFKWSNDFSWFNSKNLSYKLELLQPSIAVAEQSRSLKARSMLQAAAEDSHVAAMHLAASRASAQRLGPEIAALQKQVQDLVQQLESKRLLLARSEAEVWELEARIARNEANKPGLCIRTLNQQLLRAVLTMCGPRECARFALVCKHWNATLMVTPSTGAAPPVKKAAAVIST